MAKDFLPRTLQGCQILQKFAQKRRSISPSTVKSLQYCLANDSLLRILSIISINHLVRFWDSAIGQIISKSDKLDTFRPILGQSGNTGTMNLASSAWLLSIRRVLFDPSRRHISENRSAMEKTAQEKFCFQWSETYPRDSRILSKL